jgi:hypothetical protein
MGKKHNNLVVDLEFQEDGNLQVSIIKNLTGVIEEFPELKTGTAASPAADRLIDIRDKKEAMPLEKEMALAFHHTTAQLLLMAARAC